MTRYWIVSIVSLALLALGYGLMWSFPKGLEPRRAVAYSSNNIRQVGIALTQYAQDHNGELPRDIVDAQGNKLWSWRVHLLPYLEQQALYGRLRLDEAWDSPHNRRVSSIYFVPAFISPTSGPPADRCSYLPLVGATGLFDDPANHLAAELGWTETPASTRAVFVEVDSSYYVPWSKPQDLDVNTPNFRQHISECGGRGYLMVFSDSRSLYVNPNIDDVLLMDLFTGQVDAPIRPQDLQAPIPLRDWKWPGILGAWIFGLTLVLGPLTLLLLRALTPTTPSA